mmetsp:Transcript_102141/g.288480  ORF Transcript_102141/g.288480 Transcript_102141/m.288480 type:complete len:374 (-) Transcript_102141:395-1516(-)
MSFGFSAFLDASASAWSNVCWVLMLGAVVVLLWACRERWMRKAYEATCGKLACPDPRAYTCCGCISMGWCIMNVCCPVCCPKFHPPFGLRLVIIKARRLPIGWADMATGSMSIYAEVRAGTNPVKSTSVQTYRLKSGVGGVTLSGDDTVWWNEPIDLVMCPGDHTVRIELCQKATPSASPEFLGRVNVPVDGFYQDPGMCTNLPWCNSYPFPKWCHRWFKTAYHWPFIRGAPRKLEFRVRGSERITSETGTKTRADSAALDGLDASLISDKHKALLLMQRNGMELEWLPEQFRADKDVVMTAVSQNPDAIAFASEDLRQDAQIVRIAAQVPTPMILELRKSGEPAGRLWLYFVLYDLDAHDELPTFEIDEGVA